MAPLVVVGRYYLPAMPRGITWQKAAEVGSNAARHAFLPGAQIVVNRQEMLPAPYCLTLQRIKNLRLFQSTFRPDGATQR
jgi:hypothetical protein